MNKLTKVVAIASVVSAAALAVQPVVAEDADQTAATTQTVIAAPTFAPAFAYPGLVEQAYMEAMMDQQRDLMRQRFDAERQAMEAQRDAFRGFRGPRFERPYRHYDGFRNFEDATRDSYKAAYRQQLDENLAQQAKAFQAFEAQQLKLFQQAEAQRQAAWEQYTSAVRQQIEQQQKAASGS